ncbi:MAG: magnesium/cobalt transporter CorA [Bacteroidota bacterium]|nr:magnesium/cobalt transporter CorA [Bacteroidota bacterium]
MNFVKKRTQKQSIDIQENIISGLPYHAAVLPPATMYIYNSELYDEQSIETVEQITDAVKNKSQNKILWIDIEGKCSKDIADELGKIFNLHELEMEDMINLYQRPKVEEYHSHLFLVSRMLYYNKISRTLTNEQVSFFVYENILLTIQEDDEDAFEPVREKLRKSKTSLRSGNAMQLAYFLMDAIVDNYYPMLEEIGDRLDDLESKLLKSPEKSLLSEIQNTKREVFFLRKAIWAERDKINELIRFEHHYIDDKLKIYLRDTYDHCVQIIDIIESHKEISYSLADVYLSSQNNKMSEVMKVLTVISSIFIPLTFIAGVYGMNFSQTDSNGNFAADNMPELHHPHGYLYVLIGMFILAMAELIYFRYKRWI